MLIKRIFCTLIISFIFFIVGCSAKNQILDKSQNEIQNEVLTKPINALNTDYSNFDGFNMAKDNVNFKIDGKTLNLKSPIYLDKNRYYICLNELTEQLNGKIEKSDNLLNIKINDNDYSINLSDNTVTCPNKNFTLKKLLLNENDIYYIGFSDFGNMLNLHTRWNKDDKTISSKTNGINIENIIPYKSKINQIGLIRFEDIGVSSQPYDKYYFENLRIIATYMDKKNIPYHIAWIPRFIIPNSGVDNNPLTKNNFEIAEMVYSLDYFKFHNGIIGLHGYTHQYGNYESGAGFEFGRYEPSTQVFKEKIEKAIETASYLDISIDFFEVPHYEITPKQNKIAEQYFNILYYPFNDFGLDKADLTKPQLSPYNNSSYYISTPFDYIPCAKEDVALNRIKNTSINKMGSVFFHPNLEKTYIHLSEDSNGAPVFSYDDNSVLKQLISILEEKGYNMVKVTDSINRN